MYLCDQQISVIQSCGIELDENLSIADMWDVDFLRFEAIKPPVVAGHDPLSRGTWCHIEVMVVVVCYKRRRSIKGSRACLNTSDAAERSSK